MTTEEAIEEYWDYFFVDNATQPAYIPCGMVDSLYFQQDVDGYDPIVDGTDHYKVVYVTRAGKEYIQSGFSLKEAQEYCCKVMQHIDTVNRSSTAERTNKSSK